MSLTQEQINNWVSAETTQEVMKMFQEELDACQERLVSGEVIGETVDSTAQEVSHLVGMIKGLSMIFNLEGEQDES